VTRFPRDPGAADLASRLSWRFAEDGRSVVCTVVPPRGAPVLEVSHLGPAGPAKRTAVTVSTLGPHSQLLPISGGQVLICHHRDGGQQVDLVTLGHGQPSVRRLLSAAQPGLRLIAPPGRESGGESGATSPSSGPERGLAFAVSHGEDARSMIWELGERGALRPVAVTPGIFTGGIWLDSGGRRLGGEVTLDGRPCNGVAVDLASGSCETVLSLSERSNDRLVAYSAAGGVLVVSTDLTGEVRLGTGRPDDGPIGFPPGLHRGGHEVRLIALDREGRSLLVAHELGATSLLSVYDWRSGRSQAVQADPGIVVGPGVLRRSSAHLIYSTPSTPAAITTLRRGDAGWSLTDEAVALHDRPRPVPARPVVLPGASRPVEAVSYGRHCQSDPVVIALHGGPLDAWRMGFDPLLHTLAANGFAVVAPNQRGSTHYGVAHALAIRDCWGGPDLDDVLAIGREVLSDRPASAPRPIVLGSSYGAFLALLAAAVDPSLWAGCVAISPFLSGPRLYPEAGETIRTLVERMGGLTVPSVDGKARDVFERCGEITAPVLLIHGANDDVIPVGQSRLLYRHLAALGHPSAELLEIPGVGHDPAVGLSRALVFDRVLRFCRGTQPTTGPGTFPGPHPPYELAERR
jgi:pimeloyl-ACP methyl ester carboxylesterase